MSNEDLMRTVNEELSFDPKVDSAAIAVSASSGEITLRGTVGSFRQKREAKRDVERVQGVTSVRNELEVLILGKHRREDADLRGDVLRALVLDSLVPATVDATVEDALVWLTGSAKWQYQREEAERVATSVPGVLDVFNEIVLKPGPRAADIEHAIKKALIRNAQLDASRISVTTSNGIVKVQGIVHSWTEHNAAVSAAWAAPGVTDVDDGILIEN